MIEKEVQELLSFIDGNPTAYHTTASVRNILLNAGFSELLESRRWQLEPGRSYFVCRNGSSILAFRMGEQLENYSFNVAAAHTDFPCFRIKENAEIHMGRKYPFNARRASFTSARLKWLSSSSVRLSKWSKNA